MIAIILLILVVITGSAALLSLGVRRSATRVLDYDKRWQNKKYVEMIHDTREREQALGFELTECECSWHKPLRLPPPPKAQGVERPAPVLAPNEIRSAVLPPDPPAPVPWHIDSESPAYRVYKLTEELYYEILSKTTPAGWHIRGAPKTFLDQPIISIREDHRNRLVYVKVARPVETNKSLKPTWTNRIGTEIIHK